VLNANCSSFSLNAPKVALLIMSIPSELAVVLKDVVAALKDGKDKADIKAKSEMSKITEGLNLPAGLKLPF